MAARDPRNSTDIPLRTDGQSPGVAALWARARIADLFDQQRRGADEKETRDAVVVTAPYYFGWSESETEAYFRAIADRVSLPVVLYDIPGRTHNEITRDVILRLSEHPNIVGLKDTTTQAGRFIDMLLELEQRPDAHDFDKGHFIDLLESAYVHGFRHILLLNGHGGNTASLQVALAEALNELHGLQVQIGIWWREPEVKAVMEEAFPGQPGGHANASETSMVLAIRPDVVRLERAEYSPEAPSPGFLTRQVFMEHFPHGVIGSDPRKASAEVGERALVAAVDVYERLLQAW